MLLSTYKRGQALVSFGTKIYYFSNYFGWAWIPKMPPCSNILLTVIITSLFIVTYYTCKVMNAGPDLNLDILKNRTYNFTCSTFSGSIWEFTFDSFERIILSIIYQNLSNSAQLIPRYVTTFTKWVKQNSTSSGK